MLPNYDKVLFKIWKRAYDEEERMELFQTSSLDKGNLVLLTAFKRK